MVKVWTIVTMAFYIWLVLVTVGYALVLALGFYNWIVLGATMVCVTGVLAIIWQNRDLNRK